MPGRIVTNPRASKNKLKETSNISIAEKHSLAELLHKNEQLIPKLLRQSDIVHKNEEMMIAARGVIA